MALCQDMAGLICHPPTRKSESKKSLWTHGLFWLKILKMDCKSFYGARQRTYLVQHLDTSLGVKCIGTVRPNRTGGATLMTDKELMKRGRGAFDYRSAEGVIAVKWFDNKCVNLLSNASGIMPLSTVKRWSKESKAKVMIPCPSLIPAYNEHMGGIDLSDMLVHLYKTPAKSTRWYLPLFGYMLDLSIANSWLVYKRECGQLNQKPITLKRFRLAVAHSVKQVNKPASKVGRPSSSSPPPPK